jgi:branched-chain amino acid transport system permease protein
MADSARSNFRRAVLFLLLAALAAIPLYGDVFYTRLFTRIMIYAIAALSLDLILGYGGMVSLGHAAFLGVGAYTVGILSLCGIQSAYISWPLAMLVSMLIALVIGAISLRVIGVSFIMITLAFAQMLYYCFISLKGYGGTDGMTLAMRSSLGGLLDIGHHARFYYLVLGILLLILFLAHRLVHSRFGLAIQGIRDNELRMRLLGFPTFRYKVLCFVLVSGIAGLAGALMANQSMYVGPALMHWKQSAEILAMVILGGMGSLIGPMLGAAALLLSEEILSNYTEHWMIILGPLLIIVVLCGRKGIYGMLGGSNGHD